MWKGGSGFMYYDYITPWHCSSIMSKINITIFYINDMEKNAPEYVPKKKKRLLFFITH